MYGNFLIIYNSKTVPFGQQIYKRLHVIDMKAFLLVSPDIYQG
jgi:hypothetical protein